MALPTALLQPRAVMLQLPTVFLFEMFLPSHISSKGQQNYRDIHKGEQEMVTAPPALL